MRLPPLLTRRVPALCLALPLAALPLSAPAAASSRWR